MEACNVKGGQGSCISIPQIPVGKLAYQDCNRDRLSRAGAGASPSAVTEPYLQKVSRNLRGWFCAIRADRIWGTARRAIRNSVNSVNSVIVPSRLWSPL